MEPTESEKRTFFIFLFFILGAWPALYCGFQVGRFTDGLGPEERSPSWVLVRGLVCAAIPLALALIAPRQWLVPTIVYSIGFFGGYASRHAAVLAVRGLAEMIHTILGSYPPVKQPAADFSLPWILAFAFWLSAFAAFLRSRQTETAP